MTSSPLWDVVVVGAGPAGSAAALGALQRRPGARVLLLDRHDFPRDKSCGDGIAPHVLDELDSLGAHDLTSRLRGSRVPVHTLELSTGDRGVARQMARPALVVPRAELDEQLVAAAVAAGAVLRRQRVREARPSGEEVLLDDELRAKVVVAADGANSQLRRSLGWAPRGRVALGIRAYAPTVPAWEGMQVIRFGEDRQPSYAWAFDRGDGWSNVGYGEVLSGRRPPPSRALMMGRLEALIPGSTSRARAWLGHQLPLSGARWRHPGGRVLLAGDAAGLVNPMTGEGIFYAVATGGCAGRIAAEASADPAATTRAASASPRGARSWQSDPGEAYRRAVDRRLRANLLSTAVAGFLAGRPAVLATGLRAADAEQGVFDDFVELGLGDGRITARVVAGLARHARP